jgi:8-oxo-dGTP pyrophosphatase MutT (NUDIX family)
MLVFEHPTAGTQVPAGTVEPGEEPARAALRELLEETGVNGVNSQQLIGTLEEPLTAGERVVTAKVELKNEPGGTQITGALNRGWRVVVLREDDDWAYVSFREYDLNIVPRAVIRRVDGWMRRGLLATSIKRYLYRLEVEDSRQEWVIESDLGNLFRCHWVPLHPRPRLVEGQDNWLRAAHPALRNYPNNPPYVLDGSRHG